MEKKRENEKKDKDFEFTFYNERELPYQKIPLCVYLREILDEEEGGEKTIRSSSS
jgi:hypothetical protein